MELRGSTTSNRGGIPTKRGPKRGPQVPSHGTPSSPNTPCLWWVCCLVGVGPSQAFGRQVVIKSHAKLPCLRIAGALACCSSVLLQHATSRIHLSGICEGADVWLGRLAKYPCSGSKHKGWHFSRTNDEQLPFHARRMVGTGAMKVEFVGASLTLLIRPFFVPRSSNK